MAGIVSVAVGDDVPLALQLIDGNGAQFPQAEIYDDAGVNLATIDLAHVGDGLYEPAVAYVMPNELFIHAVYIVYTDALHTILSTVYLRDIDTFVNNMAASAAAVWDEPQAAHYIAGTMGFVLHCIQGLSQKNVRHFGRTYNINSKLTQCTIRIYKTKADADADVNHIEQYLLEATYHPVNINEMTSYKVTRIP